MVVQHNLTAMNSNRMLGITTGSQAKATEKLSSGYKINRAADDAAGLAISEKMRKQIRGLTQASANAQDGISAVQTAEGALGEVHDMLQRMNELAVKAANGTMSESDRNAIQSEVNQLVTEIDRVAITTKFNETYLLKGDNNGEVGKLTYSVATKALDTKISAVNGVTVNSTTGVAMLQTAALAVNPFAEGDNEIKEATTEIQKKIEETNFTGTTVTFDSKTYYVIDSTSEKTSGKDYATVSEAVKAINDSASDDLKQAAFASMDEMMAALKADFSADIKTVSSFYDADDLAGGGKRVALKIETFADMNTAVDLSLHVGADSSDDNKIRMNISMMSARGLGVNGLKISGQTADNATKAIDTIADALQKVSNQRASLGAIQNRLEHTIANLDNVVENTQAAESQIRDTDMATQMVTYSNNQILAQAGQAMLAQSNQANQGVLSLLG